MSWEQAGHEQADFSRVAGVDEAGRGPLAGPVVAAAVILDPARPILGLKDSKKLSAKQRASLFELIRANALCVSLARARVREIDEINILEATMLAMRRAVLGLKIPPTFVLIDGNRSPVLPCASKTIIGGDDLEPSISAASIIAKVCRDRLMLLLDKKYPEYGFARHKGYGTACHMAALQSYGPTRVHRYSFAPVNLARK